MSDRTGAGERRSVFCRTLFDTYLREAKETLVQHKQAPKKGPLPSFPRRGLGEDPILAYKLSTKALGLGLSITLHLTQKSQRGKSGSRRGQFEDQTVPLISAQWGTSSGRCRDHLVSSRKPFITPGSLEAHKHPCYVGWFAGTRVVVFFFISFLHIFLPVTPCFSLSFEQTCFNMDTQNMRVREDRSFLFWKKGVSQARN